VFCPFVLFVLIIVLSVIPLATGWWVFFGAPVSSTNKTDHHDITESGQFYWWRKLEHRKKPTNLSQEE
jgi:hypothetical protein